MAERLNFDETVEEKKTLELLPYFPTDLERAREGQKKFNEIFERSEVLKKIAKKDKYFKDKLFFSSIGLMPEIGFYGGGGFQELNTDNEQAELKRVDENEMGLKTLHWQRFDETAKWDHSVFNPESVIKSIRNCPIPDLFPEEAKANPMKWVLENPTEWADSKDPENKARFGILSGYPPQGSSVYCEYTKGIESFVEVELTEKERKAYYKYANAPRVNRKFSKNLVKRFSEAIKTKKLSKPRAQLLKNWFSHHANMLEYFGDGFSDEDAEYFEDIKKLLSELGINYARNIYEK